MILFLIPAIYQLIAIAACLVRRSPPASTEKPVSILKPVHGITPGLYRAIQSHLDQQYEAGFELLLGVREHEAAQLTVTDPRVRVITCHSVAANRKVGTLIDLAKHISHEIIIVNDADITVPPNYLRDVVSALQPGVGLATCLYSAESDTARGRFEALGVATDFAPSALVAPFVGVSEFGLGSTLAFRKADLEKIGGFNTLSDYLADDYQLGCKLHQLGRKNVIAKPCVSTTLNPPTWRAAWKHQVRWSRTVRLSRTGGYIGLPVTFATLWAVVAAALGHPVIALALLAVRMTMALIAGYGVLRSKDALKLWYLIPIRDLCTVAVWLAALFGKTVEWGSEIMTLDKKGRIVEIRHIEVL